MFVCKNCENLVEEIPTTKQYHDYTSLGQRLEETIDCLCHCGGEYVEAEQCKVCGEWFDNCELHGVCEVCLEDYETVGEALAIGEENTESVDGINGFVASVLSVEQINKILTKWVEENFTDHSTFVVKYLEADKSYFSEYLEDKYGE